MGESGAMDSVTEHRRRDPGQAAAGKRDKPSPPSPASSSRLVPSKPARFPGLVWAWTLASFLAHLPWYTLQALVPALRPRRSWNARQTLTRHMMFHAGNAMGQIGATPSQSLDPQPGHEDKWVVIEPAPEDDGAYLGPVSPSEEARPARIGGTWFPRPPTPGVIRGPGKGGRADFVVVLHLHGGGFVYTNVDAASMQFMAKMWLDEVGVDAVFHPAYRLSAYGNVNPFPSALQDAVTAYMYLTRTLSIPPQNIVLAGDSSGANLAVTLLRYLTTTLHHGDNALLLPRRLVIMTPWLNPMAAMGTDADHGYDSCAERSADYLRVSFYKWGATALLPRGTSPEEAMRSEWITPAGHPFDTKGVRVLAAVGDSEILAPETRRWVDEMQRGGGGSSGQSGMVELYLEKDAIHNTFCGADMSGFETTARETAGVVKEFIFGSE